MNLKTSKKYYFMAVIALGAFTCSAPGQTEEETWYDFFGPAKAETEEGASPKSPADLEQAEQQILEQTNQFRKSQGLEPLSSNEHLKKAAEYFAQYMAKHDRYGHRADGKQPSTRAANHGYDYCLVLENIGYVYSSRGFSADQLSEKLVKGWENSEGHRENMLNPYAVDIGVAVAFSRESHHYYGVQLFGRPQEMQYETQFVNMSGETLRYQIYPARGKEGARAYDLLPRMTRTHLQCLPAKFRFDWMEESARRDMEEATAYVIRKDGEKFQIESQSLGSAP